MTVVVDIGACSWGGDVSIEPLVERFSPTLLYAFDPQPQFREVSYRIGGCRVIQIQAAAWTFDGTMGMLLDGSRSSLVGAGRDAAVRCLDFARWLEGIGDVAVVKIDAESAEYDLLDRLVETGAHRLVDSFLVEWHGSDARRGRLERDLPIREWASA